VRYDAKRFEHGDGALAFEFVAPVFQPPYYASRHDGGPYHFSVESYCDILSISMAQNKGRTLPGLANFRDIQAVFRSQSIRWDSLTKAHIESCYNDTLKFMSEAGEYTDSKLLDKYIRPALEIRQAALVDKLDELLEPPSPFRRQAPQNHQTS
jgi:hypothetical protein